RFVNAGSTAADWLNITGGLGKLITDLRTVEMFTPTSAPGDDAVLVGGLGGVFRTINPEAGGGAGWTKVGNGLPNSITKDLHYDPTDNVLIAGTWGRGAWKVPNASASLLAPGGVLQVDGDTDFAGEDDTIRLTLDANNPLLLDVFLNSVTPTLSVP